MCGILGSINIKNTNDYLNLICHRGPDASGTKLFAVNKNRVTLSHHRLAIIDLSEAGEQPMLSENNKYCIVFNGEVYNHNKLRNKLESVRFNGHSDTESIVNLFSIYDIKNNLKDLNGIFAFALLDLENEILYLTRDRFGVKPLYYWFEANQLLFSSEIRPIKAYLAPNIDNFALMNTLRLRYSPSPKTIYKNIYKVEPGQLLVFDLKHDISLTKTYFTTPPITLGGNRKEYNRLIQEYGCLFERAVERQLMSDVEIGILLSGGIDSALIAAIAKQKAKTAVKTFTVGFEGDNEGIDEIVYAKQTAVILGLEHYSSKISFFDFLDYLNQIVEIVEEPIGTTSIIPMYFLSKLAASKVKVVLSGQGADEPLGGYNKYKALPFIELSRFLQVFMPITKSIKFAYNRNETIRRVITSMQTADIVDSLLEFNSIFSVKEIEEIMNTFLCKESPSDRKNNNELFKNTWKCRAPHKGSLSNLFLYYDLRTSLADDLLMYTDKITMHFSLECRVPLLDNDLIDFIESLDRKYKFNANRGKIIHKDFAREYLPTEIIERKKMGFKSPTETWFREHSKIIEGMFASKSFCKIFDFNSVKRILQSHCNGRNLEKQIFILITIFFLLNRDSKLVEY